MSTAKIKTFLLRKVTFTFTVWQWALVVAACIAAGLIL